MSSHVVVLDASFKRAQIKVTPATSLRSVLEQACAKFNLDPDQHVLKNTKDKPVDLSLPFRLSGLVSGAKLQLVQSSRSPSVVKVALQLPQQDNSLRLEDNFPSNTPLWLILRKFEDGVAGNTNKLNLTERSAPSTDTGNGYLCYLQPCLNIGGSPRDLSTFVDLQKSLAQLGHNHGSVLIRLSFKNQGTRMEEAKAEITQYLEALSPKHQDHPQTASAHGAHAQPDVQLASAPDAAADNAAAPREHEAAQDPSGDTIMSPAPDLAPSEQPAQETGLITSSSETQMPSTASQFPSMNPGISVYAAPSDNTPAAARQAYNEADYQPSVEHANAHQASLLKLGKNQRLQSDKELDADRATKAAALASVKSVRLRIRFPDQMQVELQATQSDTPATLYSQVRDMLDNPSLSFKLQTPGSQMKLLILDPMSQKKLIQDLGIKGAVVVTFVWDDSVGTEARQAPVLKQELRGQAKELKVQEVAAQEEPEEKVSTSKPEEPKKKPSSKGDREARLLKIMGFGKKK